MRHCFVWRVYTIRLQIMLQTKPESRRLLQTEIDAMLSCVLSQHKLYLTVFVSINSAEYSPVSLSVNCVIKLRLHMFTVSLPLAQLH